MRLCLSDQAVRLVRRSPGLIARIAEATAEATLERSRRLAEQPRLAAVLAYEDPGHRDLNRYAESWLSYTVQQDGDRKVKVS